MGLKRIIVLAVVIGALGLFLDGQMMRIAKIEYKMALLSELEERVRGLEAVNARMEQLGQRIQHLEKRTAPFNAIASRLNVSGRRLALLDQTVLPQVLEKGGIRIFKTRQTAEDVEDARILNSPSHQNDNWGKNDFIGVGGVDHRERYRSLIKFNEIRPETLRGQRILAATLHLKQHPNPNGDHAAEGETLNLYAIKKRWGGGTRIYGPAKAGEVSWFAARRDEENWATPGCGSETGDYDPVFLATSGPSLWGNVEEWVPFSFTAEGVRRLQDWFDGKDQDYHGFLIKSIREETSHTMLEFYSSEYEQKEDRPYLEIFYVE